MEMQQTGERKKYGDDVMPGNQICKKCFKAMRFGYMVKDEIWSQLPEKWVNKVLCIECFLEELEKVAPKQKFGLNNFLYLYIFGDYDNDDFGGTLMDNDYGKDRKLYLGD